MTTKFPSTLVLMELAEELSAKNCELQLQWIRRDLNQLADDLTNENFASFDPNFRVDLKGEALEWRVLGRLLAHATKRTKKAPATRFAKRPRTSLGDWLAWTEFRLETFFGATGTCATPLKRVRVCVSCCVRALKIRALQLRTLGGVLGRWRVRKC